VTTSSKKKTDSQRGLHRHRFAGAIRARNISAVVDAKGESGKGVRLTVTVQEVGGLAVLRCVGRIARGEETAILCTAVRQRWREVVLDLSRVDAIDAAGIGALLSLQAAGIYLKLRDPSRRVREILSITKLDSVVEICESQSSGEMAVVRDEIYVQRE